MSQHHVQLWLPHLPPPADAGPLVLALWSIAVANGGLQPVPLRVPEPRPPRPPRPRPRRLGPGPDTVSGSVTAAVTLRATIRLTLRRR